VTLSSYIGAKLYYWGFCLQPPNIKRALSLFSQIGLVWSETNPEMLSRVMRGEKLTLGIDLRTQELSPADRSTPSENPTSRNP
jgi:hypothetical protein